MTQPFACKRSVNDIDIDDNNTRLLLNELQAWLNNTIINQNAIQSNINQKQLNILSSIHTNTLLHKHLQSTPSLRSIINHCITHCTTTDQYQHIHSVIQQYNQQQQYNHNIQQINNLKHHKQQLQSQLQSQCAQLNMHDIAHRHSLSQLSTNNAYNVQHVKRQCTILQARKHQLQQRLITIIQHNRHVSSSDINVNDGFISLVQSLNGQCIAMNSHSQSITTDDNVQLHASNIIKDLQSDCVENSMKAESLLNNANAVKDKINKLISMNNIDSIVVQQLQQQCMHTQIGTVKQIINELHLQLQQSHLLTAKQQCIQADYNNNQSKLMELEQTLTQSIVQCKSLVSSIIPRQHQLMQHIQHHTQPLIQQCAADLQRSQSSIHIQQSTATAQLQQAYGHNTTQSYTQLSEQLRVPLYIGINNANTILYTMQHELDNTKRNQYATQQIEQYHILQNNIQLHTDQLCEQLSSTADSYTNVLCNDLGTCGQLIDMMHNNCISELHQLNQQRFHQPALQCNI